MSYEASCPQCGAQVVFNLDSSLLKICPSCGSAIARKGANLENYGKVADLVSTGSLLKLGLKGRYEGAPPFTLVGRIQINHGSGTWDEWLMAFKDGKSAWLSESQGKFHYMGQVPLPPLPSFDHVQVGAAVDLGNAGSFVVTEKQEGRFVSAEGELSFDVAPGSALHYADIQGRGGRFGTLDYGTGSEAEAAYVGSEVSLDELGFAGLKPETRAKAAAGQALKCPQCGGPLELRAPDETLRIACPYCGSLLDAKKDLKVIEVMTSVEVKPLIPLGSKGKLFGAAWTLIGFMERSVNVEGIRYAWREYLLHEPKRGFRWLTESKGHWSFVDPVHAGDVESDAFGSGISFAGRSYKHFQSGQARVDHVLGEFYWAVERGDTSQSDDYVSPPHILSRETTGSEVNYSFGTYLEPEEVWRAFAVRGSPPEKQGIAPNQPWPHAEDQSSVSYTAALLVSFVMLAYIFFAVTGGRQVFSQRFDINPRAQPNSPENAVFTDKFEIPRTGNVEVRVEAPVNNTWLYLDGALINDDSGEVDEFDAEVAYYAGADSDGSWSEGGQNARAYVGSVSRGRYVMRVQPQWEAGKAPSSFSVTLRSGVPRFYQAALAFAAILAWPLLMAWRRMRFEAARWSESDHPWVSAGGEDE